MVGALLEGRTTLERDCTAVHQAALVPSIRRSPVIDHYFYVVCIMPSMVQLRLDAAGRQRNYPARGTESA